MLAEDTAAGTPVAIAKQGDILPNPLLNPQEPKDNKQLDEEASRDMEIFGPFQADKGEDEDDDVDESCNLRFYGNKGF